MLVRALNSVLAQGIEQACKQNIFDFTDMIWIPSSQALSLEPERYDVILVDECQDLSPCQRELVLRAVKVGGLRVFVGDPNQAIFGFAGASLQSVNEIVALGGQFEGGGKGEVVRGAGIEVQRQDGSRIGDNGLNVHGVNERLGKGGRFQGSVVEAVDVVPDCITLSVNQEAVPVLVCALTANLFILVLSILNTSHEDGSLVWEDQTLAVLAQVLVAGPEHGVQHALVQQEVSHPFRNDDIDLWERQLNLLHLALQKCNLV